jgi:hypothetical protein
MSWTAGLAFDAAKAPVISAFSDRSLKAANE